MFTGIVTTYDGRKGFGYIRPENGGKDIYVHISEIDRAYVSGLKVGQRLNFEIQKDHYGRNSAIRLQLLPASGNC